MDINKKQMIETFLRVLSHIADKEYQKKVWIRGEGSEVDDFDETICHFFDEGDPILQKYKDYEITESQYYLLKDFRERLEAFTDENCWPPDFIDSSAWAEIMKLAGDILSSFGIHK